MTLTIPAKIPARPKSHGIPAGAKLCALSKLRTSVRKKQRENRTQRKFIGHERKIIPSLIEIGFDLRQQIIINKGIKSVAGRATKNYRIFPNVTESILFLTQNNINFSRDLLKSRQKELNLSSKYINEALGVKSNGGGMWSIYTGKNICEQFPTREIWSRLQEILTCWILLREVYCLSEIESQSLCDRNQ